METDSEAEKLVRPPTLCSGVVLMTVVSGVNEHIQMDVHALQACTNRFLNLDQRFSEELKVGATQEPMPPLNVSFLKFVWAETTPKRQQTPPPPPALVSPSPSATEPERAAHAGAAAHFPFQHFHHPSQRLSEGKHESS